MNIVTPVKTKVENLISIVLTLFGGACLFSGPLILVGLYYSQEELAWIINGIAMICYGFAIEAPFNTLPETTNVFNWCLHTVAPLGGVTILLFTYLCFGIGVIPQQLLLPTYAVVSLLVGWGINRLSYDIAGRGIGVVAICIASIITILLY